MFTGAEEALKEPPEPSPSPKLHSNAAFNDTDAATVNNYFTSARRPFSPPNGSPLLDKHSVAVDDCGLGTVGQDLSAPSRLITAAGSAIDAV